MHLVFFIFCLFFLPRFREEGHGSDIGACGVRRKRKSLRRCRRRWTMTAGFLFSEGLVAAAGFSLGSGPRDTAGDTGVAVIFARTVALYSHARARGVFLLD